MKNILSFEDFLNESVSNSDTAIIDRAYVNGNPTSLKTFKKKFLKGDDFDMGGVIHIHGSIKGSLAVETKTIDVYHFNEDDPEVMNLTTWSCVDNIKGGDSGWKMTQKTNIDFSKEVENLLNISGYDSSDYTERFVVLYENPDYKMKSNTFILESINESFTDDAWQKFLKEREKLFKNITIEVNARIRKEDEMKFIFPFLNMEHKFEDTNKGLKDRIKWLKGITFINIEIQDKKPVGYNVFYSGTIETDYGTEPFVDINNGFSIGMG